MKKLPFPSGSTVIRTTETDESNTGTVKGYTEDGKYAHIHWNDAPEPNKTTMHKVANLCTPDDWRAIQRKQAELPNVWKAGARR